MGFFGKSFPRCGRLGRAVAIRLLSRQAPFQGRGIGLAQAIQLDVGVPIKQKNLFFAAVYVKVECDLTLA